MWIISYNFQRNLNFSSRTHQEGFPAPTSSLGPCAGIGSVLPVAFQIIPG